MDAIEILRKLIRFNTVNDQENQKMMDWIEQYLESYGFKVTRTGKNLIAEIGNDASIGFLGHTDTVAANRWEKDPFTLTEVENRLYGLGSCDMKGGIAAILSAISNVKEWNSGCKLYFTHDEEIGFSGIIALKDEVFPSLMIIGEPTDNTPIVKTKGLLEYKIIWKGISAHSSAPNKGKSAITPCLQFMEQLNRFYQELKEETDEDFSIPYTTMNLGKISGGTAINAVPDQCELLLDFRIIKKEQVEKIKAKVSELLNLTESYSSTILNEILPKDNREDISYVEVLSKKKEAGCFITEGSFIDSNIVILGPGPDNAHQKDEFITKESLYKTVELYQKILEYNLKKEKRN